MGRIERVAGPREQVRAVMCAARTSDNSIYQRASLARSLFDVDVRNFGRVSPRWDTVLPHSEVSSVLYSSPSQP